MERLSIASFLQNGHTFHLYAYDLGLAVSAGVVLKSAEEILPISSLFRNNLGARTYTAFSSMFRYKVLFEKGGYWSDLDMVCLKPLRGDLHFRFGYESGKHVGTSIMFARAGSELMSVLYEETEDYRFQKKWGETGPKLLTKLIVQKGLQHFVSTPEVFFPVAWSNWRAIFSDFPLSDSSETVHLWNEMMGREGISGDIVYSEETLIGRLQRRYLLEACNELGE